MLNNVFKMLGNGNSHLSFICSIHQFLHGIMCSQITWTLHYFHMREKAGEYCTPKNESRTTTTWTITPG